MRVQRNMGTKPFANEVNGKKESSLHLRQFDEPISYSIMHPLKADQRPAKVCALPPLVDSRRAGPHWDTGRIDVLCSTKEL